MTATITAVRREEYDLAALRLLLGLLTAMRESAPTAREELIALLRAEDAS